MLTLLGKVTNYLNPTENGFKRNILSLYSFSVKKNPYRHQYFIDFDQFEWADPVYINLIRDPVDRFASFYYFSRFGNKRAQDAGRTKQQVPSNILNENIDDCITRRRTECTEPIWHTVPYMNESQISPSNDRLL